MNGEEDIFHLYMKKNTSSLPFESIAGLILSDQNIISGSILYWQKGYSMTCIWNWKSYFLSDEIVHVDYRSTNWKPSEKKYWANKCFYKFVFVVSCCLVNKRHNEWNFAPCEEKWQHLKKTIFAGPELGFFYG